MNYIYYKSLRFGIYTNLIDDHILRYDYDSYIVSQTTCHSKSTFSTTTAIYKKCSLASNLSNDFCSFALQVLADVI